MQYLKPKVDLQLLSQIEEFKDRPLGDLIVELMDGSHTVNEIFGELLIKGYGADIIVNMFQLLHDSHAISEDSNSEWGSFSEQDIEKMSPTLNAFELLSLEKKPPFLPYSVKTLSTVKKLKQGKIIVYGDAYNSTYLCKGLIESGVGYINHYYSPLSSPLIKTEKSNNAILNEYDLQNLEKLENGLVDFEANDCKLLVYCPDIFSTSEAILLNEYCIKNKLNFLPFELLSTGGKIGPLNIFEQSACYKCLISREEGVNMNGFSSYSKKVEPNEYKELLHNSFSIDLLKFEILKHLSEVYMPLSFDHVWIFDWFSGSSRTNPVFRLPRCSVCGINRYQPKQKLWDIL